MPYQQTGSLFFNTDLLQKIATVTKTLAKMVEPAPKRTLDLSVFALPNGAASIAAVPVSLVFFSLGLLNEQSEQKSGCELSTNYRGPNIFQFEIYTEYTTYAYRESSWTNLLFLTVVTLINLQPQPSIQNWSIVSQVHAKMVEAVFQRTTDISACAGKDTKEITAKVKRETFC